ncbi:unnamed protein product [Euphydryas editha]|uniref:Tantalus-like domain-containing protein n=1 Tax=Euphydryas editha TaxID=104508 RepID=A0AAU9TU13_EUPED|nr:unnamed protein product [Euphydryas editha]
MSEIIDLESNNLCTTEDAFEKFQAVSMYEEDEFITLSDIVSPPQPSNNISEILSEVTGHENSVSLQDSGQSVKPSTFLHEKKIENIPESNTTVQSNIKTYTLKKRGRKKKNELGKNSNQNKSIEPEQIEKSTPVMSVNASPTLQTSINSDLNYDMVIGEDSTPLLSTNVEKVITKETKNSKRKSCDYITLDVKEDTNNKSISKKGRPRKNKNSVDVLNTLSLARDENKKNYQKGKKRKLILPGTTEPLISNETNLNLNKNDGSNKFSLKKDKKKLLKDISTSPEPEKAEHSHSDLELKDDLNEEDIPLVALSNKSKIDETHINNFELETNIDQKSLNDSSLPPIKETNLLTEKSPKKRGRPKKNNDNETSDIKVNLDSKELEQDISKDEIDDISLSELKSEQVKSDSTPNIETVQPKDSEIMQESEETLPNDAMCKRNLKKPTMSDFEYNIDSIIKQDKKLETDCGDHADSLIKESSRPVRRRVKINFDYDEGSDEDPYANIELSEDEAPRRTKSGRYLSDDEYIPGKYIPGNKRGQSDESDSDIEEDFEKSSKIKKKRRRRLDSGLLTKSPKKRSRKSNGEKINSQEENSVEQDAIDGDVDVEVCLNPTVIKSNENSSQKKLKEDHKKNAWGESNEFENFLAKIVQGTDIKIKKTNPIDNEKAPLQIPVLEPTEVNKKIEMFTQTTNVVTKPVAVQTNTMYEIPMKNQVALTAEQSEKACEFLTGIVKTTSELGQLMTQKSEDFIEKKINTKHVTDTFKMDYCVKKSFLLFKLAKHNLVQMEEDLSKHYEEFLKANDLLKHREEQKIIASTSKTHSGDSDCEIVEEPVKEPNKEKRKPAFNPKTVFLNKELSIKIAKKPAEKPKPKEKLNIKGRHTVWINDSIMVKKVKPTQSFLAQDSRNKKPPDTFITLEMVSDFFKMYDRQKALQICAPYIRNEWFHYKNYICCYFFENQIDFYESSQISHNEQIVIDSSETEPTDLNDNKLTSEFKIKCPHSLSFICMQVLEKFLCLDNSIFAKTDQDLNLEKVRHANNHENINENIQSQNIKLFTVCSLKSNCFNTIKQLIYGPNFSEIESEHKVKTLVQICIDFIVSSTKDYRNLYINDKDILPQNTLLNLSVLSINKTMALLNAHYEYDAIQEDIEEPLNFTIDNVNTISEEVFLENNCHNDPQDFLQTESYVGNDECEFSDEDRTNYHDEYREDDDNWVSQVQMQELRSCIDTSITKVSENVQQTEIRDCLLNIKIEPLEEESIADSSTVKIERLDVEETNLTSLDVITKQENMTCTSNKEPIQRKNSNSYDVDAFEAFVSSNKMILSMCSDENKEVFTQTTSRVHRQYEPDLDDDIESYNDIMNLLVPQNDEVAKVRLMESSSDEGGNKVKEKKKVDKRKIKSKKAKKDHIQPQPMKEKPVLKNDVAILTRRMREKIRQEEKKNQSSDSEEDMALNLRRHKGNKDKNKKIQPCKDTSVEKEIQCNDVDSTEKIDETELEKFETKENKIGKDDTISTLNKESQDNPSFNNNETELVPGVNEPEPSLIKLNEPVEHIECQPTVSLLQNNFEATISDLDNDPSTSEILNKDETSVYVDRHGWKCYPIDSKDIKIYQYAYVSLDKLPESFVETYFRYQDVTDKTQDDAEVDKLTNLNTLHRMVHSQTKDKSCGNVKESKQNSIKPVDKNIENESLRTLVKEEPCDELCPSEDERDDFEDNFTTPLPEQSSDNCLAKDSLMNDDSDSEKVEDDKDSEKVEDDKDSEKVEDDKDSEKVENDKESNVETKEDGKAIYKTRSGRVIKSKDKDKLKTEDLMLTADKMMKKELSLLHAPVEIKEEFEDKKDVTIRPTKYTHKSGTKSQINKEKKEEDDSSSEEEKQWFTTKEKLLKRLQKKQEIPNIDDAKRAKIVSEFIEKRGDNIEIRHRNRPRRRSKKKLLERRKQLQILNRELFGDDSAHTGIKYSQAPVSKGRRNIRKVIDKKSLRRKTVLANMEEFERKQRLSQRQAQLREVLGCEEGVNVVVINDELCLEYDFEELRPAVSVHPFFTKVMKAHQYEGVKFMWDACFESVSAVASGPGGGCILAHCMGLGKTLQVLALLHTVLTHPKVNMRRVLVCCPLSTVLNWVDEINKWIGPVTDKIKVFELSKLKKTYQRAHQLMDWYNGGGILIIGYELFRSLTTLDPMLDNVRPTNVTKIRTALLNPGPDIIICDEGHLLKNDCSVLAVAMSRVVTKRRIVLTGTPMQNNLREYYCMVNFVKPNLLGTYSEYSNRFENPIMNGQHRDSREEDIKLMKARTHILHKVLEGCLQRQEASVLYPYLPKKHEYTVFISLTQCQRELYNHYLLNCTKETKQSILKDFHVLQKIWTHPQVLHNFLTRARVDEKDAKIKVEKLEDDLAREDLGASEDVKPGTADTWWLPHVADDALHDLRASNKFLIIFLLLDECVALGDKVLIFSTSLFTMDALEFFLRARGWALGTEYYRLDGSVPAEVRQKWCREFNAPSNTTTKLFLISTRAGCLGLNMTAANRVIILDTSWNPAHDIQSIFRVYRFGQKKDCYIYRLVAMVSSIRFTV